MRCETEVVVDEHDDGRREEHPHPVEEERVHDARQALPEDGCLGDRRDRAPRAGTKLVVDACGSPQAPDADETPHAVREDEERDGHARVHDDGHRRRHLPLHLPRGGSGDQPAHVVTPAPSPKLARRGRARSSRASITTPSRARAEDRCLGVGVDRNDGLRAADSGEVLARTGDAEGEVDVRADGLPGQADLPLGRGPAGVDRGERRPDGAAEQVGELLELREGLGRRRARHRRRRSPPPPRASAPRRASPRPRSSTELVTPAGARCTSTERRAPGRLCGLERPHAAASPRQAPQTAATRARALPPKTGRVHDRTPVGQLDGDGVRHRRARRAARRDAAPSRRPARQRRAARYAQRARAKAPRSPRAPRRPRPTSRRPRSRTRARPRSRPASSAAPRAASDAKRPPRRRTGSRRRSSLERASARGTSTSHVTTRIMPTAPAARAPRGGRAAVAATSAALSPSTSSQHPSISGTHTSTSSSRRAAASSSARARARPASSEVIGFLFAAIRSITLPMRSRRSVWLVTRQHGRRAHSELLVAATARSASTWSRPSRGSACQTRPTAGQPSRSATR